jgi:hypothetical protein
VTWDPYPPLPLAAVRDLHGVTRAMYRAERAQASPDASRLRALEDIGRTLRAVLRAGHAHPGTIVHGEAWTAAERATKALTELVGESPLGPLVAATARLVSRPGAMV